MNLFMDASVLLAASGSLNGASREIFRLAPDRGWNLIATPYVLEETRRNLPDLPADATEAWSVLRTSITLMADVLTLDHPAVFGPAKDRPILFSALAWADLLLTLDQNDFGDLIGQSFYGLPVLRPGLFLRREREAGRLG